MPDNELFLLRGLKATEFLLAFCYRNRALSISNTECCSKIDHIVLLVLHLCGSLSAHGLTEVNCSVLENMAIAFHDYVRRRRSELRDFVQRRSRHQHLDV